MSITVSMFLEAVASSMDAPYEVSSSEDLIAIFEEVNRKWRERMEKEKNQTSPVTEQAGDNSPRSPSNDRLTAQPGTEAAKLTAQPGPGADKLADKGTGNLTAKPDTGADKLPTQPSKGADKLVTQPVTEADNYIDGEKSPEMTIKALLNTESGVGEPSTE